MTGKPVPVELRFWTKVEVQSPGCWIWKAGRYPNGYGLIHVTRGTSSLAHRVAWQILIGPIPEGMDLDHLCRVRACVNPDHLEPTTRSTNLRRGAGPRIWAVRLAQKTTRRDIKGRLVA